MTAETREAIEAIVGLLTEVGESMRVARELLAGEGESELAEVARSCEALIAELNDEVTDLELGEDEDEDEDEDEEG